MLKFFKRLWKDRRGNALVIAGLAMPVMMGGVGLATDTVQWAVWKRELQRAADSAAFAGTYASAASETVSTSVNTDLARNNHVGIALKSGYPQIAYPTSSNYTNAVQVTLAIQQSLNFSGMFMSSAPTITASATAALIDAGDYCVIGLRKDTTAGITIGGNTNTNMGCRAISNSRNSSNSVNPNGASYVFTSEAVAGVGGLPSSITGVSKLLPYHMAMPDPYAGTPTDIPSGTPCKTFNQNTYTTTSGTGQNKVTDYHLKGNACYSSFAPNGNNVYHLETGVYYLNNTDFQLNGQDTLVSDTGGVTIILTGTTPGGVKINGTSTLQLSAQSSGTYKDLLFIQSANATTDNGNTINGTSGTTFDGAFYFPKGQLTMAGTTGSSTKCAMLVAYTVNFTGNSDLQNNTVGCNHAVKKKGKDIRLIA
jgi:Flp pilus assembly protein TadG